MTTTPSDGGPAFPMPAAQFNRGGTVVRVEPSWGMSLRDWFAGQALNGLVAGFPHGQGRQVPPLDQFAAQAYELADEMIEARETGGKGDHIEKASAIVPPPSPTRDIIRGLGS